MAVVTGATLATFGLAAGLSLIWGDSAELAFGEFNRVMLYLGVFVLVVVSARRATAARWADGLAFGVAAVGILALVSRLFPRLIDEGGSGRLLPVAQTYLNYPIDYWNGLGILLGLSFPLLLRTGVAAPSRVARGLAVGLLPAVATALYLTSSRGERRRRSSPPSRSSRSRIVVTPYSRPRPCPWPARWRPSPSSLLGRCSWTVP